MANKKIIAKIEITGIEDWDDFKDSENVQKTEQELRELEIEIADSLIGLLNKKDFSVKCNLIF